MVVVAGGPPCKVCRAPTLRRRGGPRAICGHRDCLSEWGRRAQRVSAESARRRRAARKTKRCGPCDRDKPLTREHWSPASYHPDGTVRHWASTCKPCQAAYQRDKYATQPERRERAREAARRQREEGRAPHWRDVDRGKYVRQRALRRPPERPGLLEPAPLVELLEHEAEQQGVDLVAVCGRAGVDDRQLRHWRRGQRLHFDVAERVVLRLGVRLEALWPDHRLASVV